jgi:nucleoside-diphosphate-sugar epimerase
MKSSILITGAQGFIGRYLAAALLEDERNEVIGVGRSPPRPAHFTHEVHVNARPVPAPIPLAILPRRNYRYIQVDLADHAAVCALVGELRPRTVIHLAGSLRDERFDALVSNNLHATYNLCEALLAIQAPTRLIFASSGSVYGDVGANGSPLRESGASQPIDHYSVTKRASEDIIRLAGFSEVMKFIIARIFNVIGPGQEERHLAGHVASQVADVLRGTTNSIRVGPLVTSRDFIDVRDVARALAILTRSEPNNSTYNIASGDEIPVQRIVDILLTWAGDKRPAIVQTGARPADLSRQIVDVTALQMLGWKPTFTLEESLKDLLSYYVGLGVKTKGCDARD